MSVQDQREKMISDIATILEWQKGHDKISGERQVRNDKDHQSIIELLKLQNGRVLVNTGKINWIIGVGSGIAFLLGLGHFLI